MTLSRAQAEARRSRIGASEVAALLDPPCHPFTTPQAIYERIIEGREAEWNDAMLDGKLAEPYVLALARDKWLLKVRACPRAYVHPELPLTASPDATMDDGLGILEIKTTSALWQSQPPDNVIAQVQAQLLLTGRQYAHVVVWNGRLRLYTLDRDEELMDRILQGVRRFTEEHLYTYNPPIASIDSRNFHIEVASP